MSQPNNYYDNPARQLLVNDVDLSGIAFSIQVELNENGIPMATLVADNDDAKAFLSKLVVGDTIVVKGLATSNEAYQVENSINWSAVLPCFSGTIQELSPSITQAAQQASVMALGLGFQLKEMKVNSWYGDITNLPQIANVVSFSNQINQWATDGQAAYNQSPYIGCYSGESSWEGVFQYQNQNYIHINYENLGGYMGGFGFSLNEDYDYNPFLYCKLHIVAGLYNNNSGHSLTGAIVTPYYSIDNGVTWHAFTTNVGASNIAGIITNFSDLAGTFPTTTNGVSGNEGGAGGFENPDAPDWLIPFGWTYDSTYNPLADYVHGPPRGEDDWMDITTDMNNAGGFNHNLQIKLQFSGSTGGAITGSGVAIIYMYLEYAFNTFSGLTARQLLAGDNITKGIIPNYINKVFNGVLDTNGNVIPTGYAVLGTDYIYKETPNGNNQVPSLTLPYNDGFQAVNDVLRYVSGLNLLQNKVGYHWKLDTASNLLVAPVDNHHVTGVDGSHYADAVPNTIPWVLRPYPTPIVVKQSMITQNLKTSVPKGNMILISGQYQIPDVLTDPCQGYNLEGWYWYWVDGLGGQHFSGTGPVEVIANDPEIVGNCLKFPLVTAAVAYYNSIFLYPIGAMDEFFDATKLMGRDITGKITALLKVSGGIVGAQIRLYWHLPNNPGLFEPDTSQFMYYDITKELNTNNFVPIEINLPNTKFLKNFEGWSMGQDLGFLNNAFNVKYSTTHTIFDIGSVMWIGIAIFTGFNTLASPTFAELSDLKISGTFIRGVYDPTNVKGPFTYPPIGLNYGTPVTYANGFGLRMLTIKNSLLYTNTMNPISLTDYLSLECIYELERNEIPYTQGEITIPFDPIWLDGQQVWLQAEDVIPIGSQVLSGAINPTTSTGSGIVSLGSYYVNTSTWEVFAVTHISGATITWTDQSTVRYKINRWFRISKVIHRFSKTGATTSLQVTDDTFSSFPVNTLDSYTTIVRATNPDFQTHTNGSLKASGDFVLGLTPVISLYTPSLF